MGMSVGLQEVLDCTPPLPPPDYYLCPAPWRRPATAMTSASPLIPPAPPPYLLHVSAQHHINGLPAQ